MRLFPAFFMEIATACFTAFFFVLGWLVPMEPFFSHSLTNVLILLLTTVELVPFFNGMIFLLPKKFYPRLKIRDLNYIAVPNPTRVLNLFSLLYIRATVRYRTSKKNFLVIPQQAQAQECIVLLNSHGHTILVAKSALLAARASMCYWIRRIRNKPSVSLSLVKYNAPSSPNATPIGRAQRSPLAV